MARKQRRARPGSGSVYWSATQERYVGEITLGHDKAGRIRKVIVGPRGCKDEDARLGVKDRLAQLQRKQPAPRRGQRRVVSRMTLGEYLEGWLRDKDLSDAAIANYTWAIEQYLVPQLGATRLHDLERDQLKRFFSTLTLGDASKEKIRTVLRSSLQDAVIEKGWIGSNPATDLAIRNRRTQRQVKEIAAWNADQAKRFLRVVKNTEHFPLFLLAIVGALGPAELFGLRWKDVDLRSGRVAIVANLTEVGGRLILKETKTPQRRRSIALPSAVLKALQARYKRIKPQPTDFVFTAPEGGGIRRTTFRARVWLPLIKKAKVPVITLYGLRHSSASLMAAMGVPLLIASRALGHSNIRTTADTYTHLFEESQREVAAKFDRFLRGL
jgi:integrase